MNRYGGPATTSAYSQKCFINFNEKTINLYSVKKLLAKFWEFLPQNLSNLIIFSKIKYSYFAKFCHSWKIYWEKISKFWQMWQVLWLRFLKLNKNSQILQNLPNSAKNAKFWQNLPNLAIICFTVYNVDQQCYQVNLTIQKFCHLNSSKIRFQLIIHFLLFRNRSYTKKTCIVHNKYL